MILRKNVPNCPMVAKNICNHFQNGHLMKKTLSSNDSMTLIQLLASLSHV